MTKLVITYHYRGLMEVPAPRNGKPNYRWVHGYSENGPSGGETQPWLTVQQCRNDAKARGGRAVVVRP